MPKTDVQIDKKAAERKVRFWTFGIMLGCGLIALTASVALTVEKFHLLQDPDAVLSCSVNAVINCATVMNTWQASVFGFPNVIIGLIAYAMVIAYSVIGLIGGKLPRWFWVQANVGYLLGAVFAYWLFFQSVYVIQVLCPWCLLVTSSTTVLFAAMTHYNLKQNNFKLPRKYNLWVQKFLDGGFHQMIVIAWIVLMIALVFLKFGGALFAQ